MAVGSTQPLTEMITSDTSVSLPPRKSRYLLYRRLGGPQGWSGGRGKSRPHRDSIPEIVQPVASRYTD
jgi:hypothetical protein